MPRGDGRYDRGTFSSFHEFRAGTAPARRPHALGFSRAIGGRHSRTPPPPPPPLPLPLTQFFLSALTAAASGRPPALPAYLGRPAASTRGVAAGQPALLATRLGDGAAARRGRPAAVASPAPPGAFVPLPTLLPPFALTPSSAASRRLTGGLGALRAPHGAPGNSSLPAGHQGSRGGRRQPWRRRRQRLG